MFKQMLMGLSIGTIVTLGSLSAWANEGGSKLQEAFFDAVGSDDPENVLELCDPRLREKIDAPILGAWMEALQDKLGEYQGMSDTDFETRHIPSDEGKIVQSKGTVHFEHGDAKSELTFCDELLTGFSVASDKLAGNWFEGPTETDLYQERGGKFIRKFLAQNQKGTVALIAPELLAVVGDKLPELMKTLADKTGEVTSVEYSEDKFTKENGGTLKVYYDLECEKGKFVAEIKFQFNGLKGYLEGFNFNPKTE